MSWKPDRDLAGAEEECRQALRRGIERSGLSLRELDRAIGWSPNYTSQVLRGNVELRVIHLLAIAKALQVPVLSFLAKESAETLSPEQIALVDQRIQAALERVHPAAAPAPPSPADRAVAQELWQELQAIPEEHWRQLFLWAPRFHHWGICELLCGASLQVVRDRPGLAWERATTAVELAAKVEGPPPWRQRLTGYCGFFVANARRVQGDIPAARAERDRALTLWEAGREGDPGLLSEVQVLSLQASLLRAEEDAPGALRLYDQALDLSGPQQRPSLLLGKSKTLAEAGDYEPALALLREARGLLPEEDFDLQFATLLNQGYLCCYLERFAEAQSLLPEIHRQNRLQNALDTLRLSWLEGRVAKGLGQIERALAHFETARQGFAIRKIAYDQAQVTLEMAELLAGEGRTAEVKALAQDLVPAFQAQGVHAEVARAIRLFHQAALQEKVSAELIRQMVRYLDRARGNPEMRFQADRGD